MYKKYHTEYRTCILSFCEERQADVEAGAPPAVFYFLYPEVQPPCSCNCSGSTLVFFLWYTFLGSLAESLVYKSLNLSTRASYMTLGCLRWRAEQELCSEVWLRYTTDTLSRASAEYGVDHCTRIRQLGEVCKRVTTGFISDSVLCFIASTAVVSERSHLAQTMHKISDSSSETALLYMCISRMYIAASSLLSLTFFELSAASCHHAPSFKPSVGVVCGVYRQSVPEHVWKYSVLPTHARKSALPQVPRFYWLQTFTSSQLTVNVTETTTRRTCRRAHHHTSTVGRYGCLSAAFVPVCRLLSSVPALPAPAARPKLI